MKYASGGITGKLGEALTVEVPVKSKSPGKKASPQPDSGRIRFSAWTRTFELFYVNPAAGGKKDFDRCRKFLDNCAGKLDDLVMLQTINIQVPKPPDGTPTGKVLWDSDFNYSDAESPDVAAKLVAECHQRGIALHAGYAVVDSGTQQGRRSIAFCKFMETASPDQIKDHASQCVQLIKSAGFDGLSFDLEINHLSVSKHGAGIEALFTELAAQMAGDNLILSYAGYPFLKDGDASSMPNLNPLPFRFCKIGKNVLARPQAYYNKGESDWKGRLQGVLKCALDDVGVDPSQFQLGIDYTGDSTFQAVRGDDMTDVCKLARSKKVGVCIWRLEGPGAPSAGDYGKWDQALNEGVPPGKPVGQASGDAPAPAKKSADAPKPAPAGPQPESGQTWFGVDYGSVDGNTPDWAKAKSDGKLSFAIVRANYGTWRDPNFKRDWQPMADNGIVRGAYLFLRFPKGGKKPEKPEAQAKALIDYVGDLAKTDFPPTIDVEFPGDGRKETGMTAAECLDGVRAAWKVIKAHYGVAPMIYTSRRVWHEDLGDIAAPDLVESPLWLTPYITKEHQPPILDDSHFAGGKKDPKVPPPWGDATNWWIHQYQGDSRGYPGFHQVDMNRFHTMVKGASGERVKWVQRRLGIDQSGTYDDAMFDKVKAHQSNSGLADNGIIDPKTFATLCWLSP